jgi:hypothetical protein
MELKANREGEIPEWGDTGAGTTATRVILVLAAAAMAACGHGSDTATLDTTHPVVGMLGLDGGTSEATVAEDSEAPGFPGESGTVPVHEAGPPPADPCIEAGTCPKGVWVDVTPSNVDLVDQLNCSNYGTQNVGVDPENPSDFYAQFMCQGIWKSTDYGQTWTGPINTGANGTNVSNCAGGITVADGGPGKPPIIYQACIRGSIGFWVSTNGGVDWATYNMASRPAQYQDIYPVVVDPYNPQHILAASHEQGFLNQSDNEGHDWTTVPLTSGMNASCLSCGTAGIFFIDTGTAATSSQTWLWMDQGSGGVYGLWRTTNGGTAWTQVQTVEHPHGASQIYNAGGGVIYVTGSYSTPPGGGIQSANAILRSTDYGVTWSTVALGGGTVVWGTPNNVYAAYSWAHGLGTTDPTNFVVAAQPGTGTWTSTPTPSGMVEGPAQVATSFDGSNYVFVGACWWAGLWRYVEP